MQADEVSQLSFFARTRRLVNYSEEEKRVCGAVAAIPRFPLASAQGETPRSRTRRSDFFARAASSWSDDELVDFARNGESRAFEELVQRQSSRIYGLLVRLLGDPTLAEDQAQETFVRAWQALPRFRGDSKFSTWLIRIALNGAHRTRAREAKRAGVPLDEPHTRFGIPVRSPSTRCSRKSRPLKSSSIFANCPRTIGPQLSFETSRDYRTKRRPRSSTSSCATSRVGFTGAAWLSGSDSRPGPQPSTIHRVAVVQPF